VVKEKKISWATISVTVLVLGFVVFLTISCGRGSGSLTQTRVFKDIVVSGLGYSTAPGGLSGTTNARGEFHYKKGDTVTFFIGNIEIGSAMVKNNIALGDLASGTPDIKDPAMVNIIRFFQSLDVDPNADIIELPAGLTDVVNSWLIIQAGKPFGVDQDVNDFESMTKDLMYYLDAQMAVYSGSLELQKEGAIT